LTYVRHDTVEGFAQLKICNGILSDLLFLFSYFRS
jgi:hypothetical protein